jgi:putative transcriptional regulator
LDDKQVAETKKVSSLTGQLLVAMPQMEDPRFARSVVYLCSHSAQEGAMGLIVNKPVDELTIEQLYAHLKIGPVMRPLRLQRVYFGGPVDPGLGFVLHSNDYHEEVTLRIADDFAMTASFDILRGIAKGNGPRRCLLALGYAGWGPGQLETEIQGNGWLSVAADSGLVFDAEDDSKWRDALAKLGVSPEMLTSGVGHA